MLHKAAVMCIANDHEVVLSVKSVRESRSIFLIFYQKK